jgi:uncharacterized protein (DUF362 family)
MSTSARAGEGIVAVCRVTDSVAQAVARSMRLADWARHVPPGSRVALKPNLCWDLPLPGAQTSPWVFDAVISVLAKTAAEIVVIEAGQLTVDVDAALERSGIGRVLRKHGLQFINMSRGSFADAHLADAFVLHDVALPEALTGRVLVSVPVLKTHGLTTISGALKNQWGCLPETRYRYHPVVHEAIADLNDLINPAFVVLDGTVSLVGRGPKTGKPRVTDIVMASADPVAVDAAAATLLGIDPAEVAHIGHAERRGLGVSTGLTVVGDRLSPVAGLPRPAPNLVALAEVAVRRSAVGRLALSTPLVGVLGWCARAFNTLWWLVSGSRLRRLIVRHSRYGAQWLGVDEQDVPTRTGDR